MKFAKLIGVVLLCAFAQVAGAKTYTKPLVLPAWAENATGSDLVQPSTTYISSGWPLTTTPPSRQYFNWVLNYTANATRYFMQRGISTWDSAETYGTSSLVQGSDGNLYQSLGSGNTNNDPTTTFGTYWAVPTVRTQTTGDNALRLANTAFVHNTIASLAPLASPALTGTPTAPTAASSDNSTTLATTAFVQGAQGGTAGTFTPTFTGFSSMTASGTVYWRKQGNLVTVVITPFYGVSNGAAMTITNVPAAIYPFRASYVNFSGAYYNGSTTATVGPMIVLTGITTWSFGYGAGQFSAWSTSGQKGMVVNAGNTFTYPLN